MPAGPVAPPVFFKTKSGVARPVVAYDVGGGAGKAGKDAGKSVGKKGPMKAGPMMAADPVVPVVEGAVDDSGGGTGGSDAMPTRPIRWRRGFAPAYILISFKGAYNIHI